MTIELNWDTSGVDAWLAELGPQVSAAMAQVGENGMALAREMVPVDTGSLRDTIDAEILEDDDNGTVELSINAGNVDGGYVVGSPKYRHMGPKSINRPIDYATATEFGTERVPNQPFMTPTSEDLNDTAPTLVGEAIAYISGGE